MMKKKSLMVWGVMLVYLLMMIVSPLSVLAEESVKDSQKEVGAFEEATTNDTQEEEPTLIDEESYFDDDFSIPIDGDSEETRQLIQDQNENFREVMEAKGFVFRTEEEKRAIIAANPEAGIEIGQISDYYLPEQSNPLITSSGSRDSITFQTLDLGDLKGTNKLQTIGNNASIFPSVAKEEEELDENDKSYFIIQGGCYDGANYYYCFLRKRNNAQIDSCIVKGSYDAAGKFSANVTIMGLMDKMQHVNDMTYNRDTEELVIVCSEDGYHHIIYTISKYDFQSGATAADFDKHYLSCKINALDYNPTRSQYVARVSGAPNKLVILDSDFRIVKIFEHDIVDGEHWVPQGLYVDNVYIYTLSYFTDSSANVNNEIENRLCIFDWDGNLIKAFQFSIDKHVEEGENEDVDKHIEAEHIFIANRRMLVGFMWRDAVDGRQNRGFSYVDLSPWTYHVQFVPESTDISGYFNSNGEYQTDGDNVCAVMFRNVSTPLRKFRVTATNKKFDGWYAYRVETGEWLYRDPNDKTINGWYTESNKPSNYIKYKYNDKQAVSKTGAPAGHVIMCAQWKDANHTFTVSFKKRGGSGTMTDQTITYGTSTALKENTFTKTYRIFMGWNAYWSEKNRWYYVSPDGATKGWYKEGYEPTGYRKYVFTNKQKIAKTVYEGSHVYMCALWNEFYIQYDANGATIEHNYVQPQFSSSCASTYQLQFYPNSIVYNDNGAATTKRNEYLTLYRQEDNKWYCSDGWYVLVNGNDSAKTKFMNIAGAGIDGSLLYPGDHLIVVAGWAQT